MNQSILLLEPNATQSLYVSKWLAAADSNCTLCDSQGAVYTHLNKSTFDAVILACNDQQKVIAAITHLRCRLQRSTPVLVIYDHYDRLNIVETINAGANDYLVKPLNQQTIVKTLEKLAQPIPHDLQTCFPYQFNAERKEVSYYGQPLNLSVTEYLLAAYLFFFRGRVVRTSELFIEIEANGGAVGKSIERQLSLLKHRLHLTTDRYWQLEAVCGAGYRIVASDASHSQSISVLEKVG